MELDLSGFFSHKFPSVVSALKILLSYIEVPEPRRNHGTFPYEARVEPRLGRLCGLVSSRFAEDFARGIDAFC